MMESGQFQPTQGVLTEINRHTYTKEHYNNEHHNMTWLCHKQTGKSVTWLCYKQTG